MKIGDLDKRIILQDLVETNNFGEIVKTYSNIATVWAKIISQKGSESFEAARMSSTQKLKIKLRYRADVKTDWRIEWEGQFYNVIDIDRTLRRDGELWLMVESVVAE